MKNSLFCTLALLFLATLIFQSSPLVGGWHRLTDAQFTELEDQELFQDILDAAQDYVQQKVDNDNFQLGDLKYVQTQIVEGTNYRLIYENDDGEQASVVVFTHPKTNTIHVISFQQNYDSDDQQQEVQKAQETQQL